MSKSSQSTNFRKVNVDELDEERFEDDAGETQLSSAPSESDIQNLLNSKKNIEALKLLLKNAPVRRSSKVKTDAYSLVLRVLTQYKSNEIEAAIKQLESQEIDILLKYIYRGFNEPNDNSCSVLLNWHEKAVAVGGLGSIMRVLTDRTSV